MNAWTKDPFFQYPTSTALTSMGDVALPIMYFDNSNMIAMFWVDYDGAQELVGAQGLTAIRFSCGKALVSVAFFEYRDCALPPYKEVGLAIAALPNGAPAPKYPLLSLFYGLDQCRAGFFIVDLPVTTDVACAAGREIWGYPKFVAPIAFSLQGSSFNGSVTDPATQSPLLRLSGRAGFAVPGPILDLMLFSTLNGKILRTLVNTRGGAKIGLPGSIRLQVSDCDHPMAHRLTKLGLKSAKPAFVSYTDSLQLRLNAGAEVT
jgi:hypothetical protein